MNGVNIENKLSASNLQRSDKLFFVSARTGFGQIDGQPNGEKSIPCLPSVSFISIAKSQPHFSLFIFSSSGGPGDVMSAGLAALM